MSIDRLLLENTARQVFDTIARNFPVASASDEFYFFPQIRSDPIGGKYWDNFNEDAVSSAAKALTEAENAMEKLLLEDVGCLLPEQEMRLDLLFLRKATRTLIEQLTEVRAWETQPTLHLTLACVGMAEAMGSRDPAAKHDRAKTLPAFFDQAGRALNRVPLLFRDLALEMITETRNYIILLKQQVPELRAALTSLDRFENRVRKVATRRNFCLPQELLERIIRYHLNCDKQLEEINQELEKEIHEMQAAISKLSPNHLVDRFPSHVFDDIPLPEVGPAGLLELYRQEVGRLAKHCLDTGLVSLDLYQACPVRVEPVPLYLSATRTASSYSIPPEYPPTGGIFYVINANDRAEARKGYQREYRILSAHETYPGHHLLDCSRWRLKSPIRRVIEQPIFYEGWACFAEEIMRLTGYFTTAGDRFLLARRRLWRAVRGKVDLGLQTGSMDLNMAADYIRKTGIPRQDAISAVRKYPLNPGYQLCYTTGLRRFLDLYQRYGQQNLNKFVAAVLNQGEIDFKDLERALRLEFVQ